MAAGAINAVKTQQLKLTPQHYEQQWFNWLESIRWAFQDCIHKRALYVTLQYRFVINRLFCRDWCISRQLWWGHRIPAYKVLDNNGQVQICHLLVIAITDIRIYANQIPLYI